MQATEEYANAAKAYQDYLEAYPHEPIVYDITFMLAETLWYSGDYGRGAHLSDHRHAPKKVIP